eukprot:GHVS01056907.1.p1 GENE.GHVS01056907.1~~GHVS01056907.1.p1  ORF type:complete len:627 (+),score=90.50 GHVS01056907.1:369-2249(+)
MPVINQRRHGIVGAATLDVLPAPTPTPPPPPPPHNTTNLHKDCDERILFLSTSKHQATPPPSPSAISLSTPNISDDSTNTNIPHGSSPYPYNCCLLDDSRVTSVAHHHATLRQQLKWEWKTSLFHFCSPSLNHRDWRQLVGESYFPTVVSPIFMLFLRIFIALLFLGVLIYDGVSWPVVNKGQIARGTSPWVYFLYLTNWQWLLNCAHGFLFAGLNIWVCAQWYKQSACSPDLAETCRDDEGERQKGSSSTVAIETAGVSSNTKIAVIMAGQPKDQQQLPAHVSSSTLSFPPILRKWLPGYVDARETAHSLFHMSPPPVPAFIRLCRRNKNGSNDSSSATPTTSTTSCEKCGNPVRLSPPHLTCKQQDNKADNSPVPSTLHFCCCMSYRPIARFYRSSPTKAVPSFRNGSNVSGISKSEGTDGDVGGVGQNCCMAGMSRHRAPADTARAPWYVRLALMLNSISLVLSSVIMVLYWFLLFPLEGGNGDFLDYWKHAASPLLVILSGGILSRLPFPIMYIFYCMGVTILYAVCIVSVYVCKVRSIEGRIGYLYGFINFGKAPSMAAGMLILCCFVLVPVVHMLWWCLLSGRSAYVAPPPSVCCCAATSAVRRGGCCSGAKNKKQEQHG